MKIIPTILLALIIPAAHAAEWTTGSAKVHFNITPGKITQTPRANTTSYANVFAYTKPQDAKTGEINTFKSDNNITYYNASNESQTIKVLVYTCVSALSVPKLARYESQCGDYSETVTLAPNTEYNKDLTPELLVSFHEAGLYNLESVATLKFPADGKTNTTFSDSNSEITVT